MQENAFQRVRNQTFSTWTVLAPSALGPPNLKHLPTALARSLLQMTSYLYMQLSQYMKFSTESADKDFKCLE